MSPIHVSESDFARMKECASVVQHEAAILRNVCEHVREISTSEKSRIKTLIFPESGSGFHEWNVVRALEENGLKVDQVVFMDSWIEPCWVDVWKHHAETFGVKSFIRLDSYDALEQWCSDNSLDEPESAIVLYINGSLKSHSSFNHGRSKECMIAAASFLRRCEKIAMNRKPRNFLGCDVTSIGLRQTWTELAELCDARVTS
jgi:hypothetical protein